MKDLKVTLGQFTVLALIGLAVWLQSPVIAIGAVLALVVKEGREYLDSKKKSVEIAAFEERLERQEDALRQLTGNVSRVVSKQAQYFGE